MRMIASRCESVRVGQERTTPAKSGPNSEVAPSALHFALLPSCDSSQVVSISSLTATASSPRRGARHPSTELGGKRVYTEPRRNQPAGFCRFLFYTKGLRVFCTPLPRSQFENEISGCESNPRCSDRTPEFLVANSQILWGCGVIELTRVLGVGA